MSGYPRTEDFPKKRVTALPIGDSERNQIAGIRKDIALGWIPGQYQANTVTRGPRGDDFKNRKRELPKAPVGAEYYEYQIGTARPGDDRPRGKKRLVVLAVTTSHDRLRMYFTDEHYLKGSFVEVV